MNSAGLIWRRRPRPFGVGLSCPGRVNAGASRRACGPAAVDAAELGHDGEQHRCWHDPCRERSGAPRVWRAGGRLRCWQQPRPRGRQCAGRVRQYDRKCSRRGVLPLNPAWQQVGAAGTSNWICAWPQWPLPRSSPIGTNSGASTGTASEPFSSPLMTSQQSTWSTSRFQ